MALQVKQLEVQQIQEELTTTKRQLEITTQVQCTYRRSSMEATVPARYSEGAVCRYQGC